MGQRPSYVDGLVNCSSYPGQCIRKCSSFSIFPDLQTVQNLSDVGICLCLPLSIIRNSSLFDNIVDFKHQYKAKNKRSKFTKSK
jgi:hypothetical protein